MGVVCRILTRVGVLLGKTSGERESCILDKLSVWYLGYTQGEDLAGRWISMQFSFFIHSAAKASRALIPTDLFLRTSSKPHCSAQAKIPQLLLKPSRPTSEQNIMDLPSNKSRIWQLS